LNLRRDPATGAYFVTDLSTNGTWINGKRLRKGTEEPLQDGAELNLAVSPVCYGLRRFQLEKI
jgi:predicted component of type VI protein secretion system